MVLLTPPYIETLSNLCFNSSVPEYYEFGLTATPSDSDTKVSCIADSRVFVVYSGKCTGRVPKAESFVSDPFR